MMLTTKKMTDYVIISDAKGVSELRSSEFRLVCIRLGLRQLICNSKPTARGRVAVATRRSLRLVYVYALCRPSDMHRNVINDVFTKFLVDFVFRRMLLLARTITGCMAACDNWVYGRVRLLGVWPRAITRCPTACYYWVSDRVQ